MQVPASLGIGFVYRTKYKYMSLILQLQGKRQVLPVEYATVALMGVSDIKRLLKK